MKQFYLALLGITLACNFIFAQDNLHPCATPNVKSEWLTKYQQNPAAFEKTDEPLVVPLTIHIVGEDNGEGYYSRDQILRDFCKLQEDFVHTNIAFFIKDEIRLINNSDLYDHSGFSVRSILAANNVPGTVNCYVVDNPAGACGYAYLDGFAVVLNDNCLGPDNSTWAHEMGHSFSLPHPFLGWQGNSTGIDLSQPAPDTIGNRLVEKVDGSNCTIAGDGFCGTPPDYLSFRWSCNAEGFSNQELVDPNGEVFRADGSFFMSYSNDVCTSRFSEDQIEAMVANILDEHPDYLEHDVTFIERIPGYTFQPIAPENNEQLTSNSDIYLEWPSAVNATAYDVIISPLPTFTSFVYFEEIQDTSVLITEPLAPNRTYFWRARPKNPLDNCIVATGRGSFRTGDVSTSTQNLEGLNALSVQPNPLENQQEFRVVFDLEESMDVQLSLFNPAGQQLSTVEINANPGRNEHVQSTVELASGLYFIRLAGKNGQAFKKLILN